MQSHKQFRPFESTPLRIRKEKKKREIRELRNKVVEQALKEEMKQGMYLKYNEYKDQNILAKNIDALLEPEQNLSTIQTSLRFLRCVSSNNTAHILKMLGEESLEKLFELILKLADSFPSNKILLIDAIWLIVNLATEMDLPLLQHILIRHQVLEKLKGLLDLSRDKDYPLLFEVVIYFYANVAGLGRTFQEMVIEIDITDILKKCTNDEPQLIKQKKEIVFFLLRNLASGLAEGFISEAKFVTKLAICYVQESNIIEEQILVDALKVLQAMTNSHCFFKLAKDEFLEQNLLNLLGKLKDDSPVIQPLLQIIVNFTCYTDQKYYFKSDLPLLLLSFFQNTELTALVRESAALALSNICGNEGRENEISELAELEEMQSALLMVLKPSNNHKILWQASVLVNNMLTYGGNEIAVEFAHAGIFLMLSSVLVIRNNYRLNKPALECLLKACQNYEVQAMEEIKHIQRAVEQQIEAMDELCRKDESSLWLVMRVTEMLGLRRGDDEECKEEDENMKILL